MRRDTSPSGVPRGQRGRRPRKQGDLPTRSLRLIAALLLVAGALASCHPGPISVPPGAQVIHVTVVGDTLRLAPTTVRAGDVYLILDNPRTDVVLVEWSPPTGESPGPLSDDDLDRIVHGDVQDTSITSGFANSEQYGNVSRLVVAPGKYLFLAGDAMERAARSGGVIAPGSMAILEVLP